jgi:hypothetical protein
MIYLIGNQLTRSKIMKQLPNPINVLLAHLIKEGDSPETAKKIVDNMLGEICREYEKLRGSGTHEQFCNIYGHEDMAPDHYYWEKINKFWNKVPPKHVDGKVIFGPIFACGLDGGNTVNLGTVLRKQIIGDSETWRSI